MTPDEFAQVQKHIKEGLGLNVESLVRIERHLHWIKLALCWIAICLVIFAFRK